MKTCKEKCVHILQGLPKIAALWLSIFVTWSLFSNALSPVAAGVKTVVTTPVVRVVRRKIRIRR